MQALLFALLLLPSTLHAQVTLFSIIKMVNGVMVGFVRLGLAIALVVFVWGIVKMLLAMNNGGSILDTDGKKGGSNQGKAIEEGKKRMVWGIVALFLIVSIWGVVALLSTLVGVSGASNAPAPVIKEM